MIGVVKQLSISFFAHPKHQKKLEEAIQNTQPESNVLMLKDLCRTRWIEWIDALDHIKQLYSSIVACFENISAGGSRMWSSDSVTDASILLLVITRTEFISALVITDECLQYRRGLTSLQGETKDIIQAVSEIKTLTSSSSKLAPITVGGLKQSLKCVMRWGLHYICTGYVVVSITTQAYQHLIPLNTLEELSQFQFWTIFFLSLTSSLVHIKKLHFKSILGTISVGNRRSCNCVLCGDESGGSYML